MKNIAHKMGLALIWISVLLLLLEIFLQAAAWGIDKYSARAQAHWLTGHLRVLALGDSNTYGLYLPAKDSYPAQLEKQWNAKHAELPLEIINLGYPGTNSFRLLANLPRILDTFHPDVVLLMIGFNDFWTPVETPATTISLSLLDRIHTYSRVYKLFYMVREKFQPTIPVDSGERQLGGLSGIQLTAEETATVEKETGFTRAELENIAKTTGKNPVLAKKLDEALRHVLEQRQKNPVKKDILNTVKYGDQVFSLGIIEGSSAGNSKQLDNNLKAMLNLLEQHHVRTVLLNYPTQHGYYPAANRKIHNVVTQTNVPFIELGSVFPENCRNNPDACPDLLYYDAHATAAGNERVATTIMEGLENYLLNNK